jgi:16S rRNA (guanine(1405)-N(7))-methyltransferase
VDADDLASRILGSAKYGHLDPELVHRVSAEAAQRFKSRNEAEKYARRKLHQAFGAFVSGSPAEAVRAAVAAVRSGTADVRETARSAMLAHSSSAERLEWLVPFYEQVAAWCGQPGSVVDLACGLNPLAIPWMSLAPDACYWACEADRVLVAALAQLSEIMPVRFNAVTCDLVASPPELSADVALLLKTVTTLQQQADGAADRVLRNLTCRHVIVSFPRRSLSGRRAYSDDARASARRLADASSYQVAGHAEFGDELVFHLEPTHLQPPALEVAGDRAGRQQCPP